MISIETENRFRRYVHPFILSGEPGRADFERIWRMVIEDSDVQAVIWRMLFVPHPVPDAVQAEYLVNILDYLHDRPTDLQLFDDVVVTQADIVSVCKTRDSEGPNYGVSYRYAGVTLEREFGYDAMHAGLCGWDEAALDAYWRVGNHVPCHYRASDPQQHAICQP